MSHLLKFYIDGQWVDPVEPATLEVINPSNEEVFATISIGSAADVDRAVAAARKAFPKFSTTSREERLALLRRVVEIYRSRAQDLANAVSAEMGAPARFALESQVAAGETHLKTMIETLERYEFERVQGTTLVSKEPIGVVGMITPWNWPLNQITCKVGPAIAAGCTMVLKPSEIAPVNAIIFAEIMEAAGVPAGVFNLVNGEGPTVGEAIARHPDVDMVSLTGSTRAGVAVAKAAADTVKRVHQELGGKSANIILDDADFDTAVQKGASGCFRNSGQSCNAPTRMLVPSERMRDAIQVARKTAEATTVGPADQNANLGPVVSRAQYDKIQALIEKGIEEGAELVAGGPGLPPGVNRGYYIRPTVFANVTPDMTIAREEIFGPVLSVMSYKDEDNAVEIANETQYGLAGYVQSGDIEHARRVAKRLRVGNVHINYPAWDTHAPFGGFKQSGNGREYGAFGLDDFLEIKGTIGHGAV